jgi:predicted nucleic acid-binding protein
MTTFIDTNVLIYLLDTASPHHTWSVTQFQKSKNVGPVIVNDIVYAEFSVGMQDKQATDEAIVALACERIHISDDALFRAGRAYKEYKNKGGTKLNVLPDFLIGAQAETEGAPLLTANVKDYLSLFPKLKLISPEAIGSLAESGA